MCLVNLILFIGMLICPAVGEQRKEIYLGGIFYSALSEDNTTLPDEQAFRLAVSYAASQSTNYDFKALTKITNPDETEDHLTGPFKSQIAACSLIREQALVIFGPRPEKEIDIVHSIADYKDIAHAVTRYIYDPTAHRSIINFYPHSSYLTSAYFSVLKLSGWKSFTLFYDDNESLLRMGDLINIAKNDDIIVTVKQLDEVGDGIYRTSLKEAVRSGERNFVLDCKIEILEEVLRQAQQVGLMTSHYSYFITNLDLQTIDLDPFQYSEANITGIRIFDPKQKSDIIDEIVKKGYNVDQMKTETALIIDAVIVIAKVINNKLSFQEMGFESFSCDSPKSLGHGYSITNHVKTSKNVALTGLIEFDGNGFRSNFDLDIIEITEEGVNKVGTWNSTKGLVSSQTTDVSVEDDGENLRNKTFKVITCLTDPYCMLKETSVQLFGNDRFEGFAIDLIHELAMMEGFNYTFLLRDDKANGAKDKDTGRWSGMIGDVMEGVADLAIADLTVTAEREEAVDFTSPFMNLGISILAKKPGNAPPSFFSFADPFAFDTWVMLALAYVVVTLSFFILGRLCQDEWTNPYPCVEEPEFLINQFSLQNAGWFAVGALMQQGTEIAPIAIATRMLTGMWWFFVLIMVSSYTANLAAFLATENPVHLFTDVNSLVANREKFNIRFGAKAKGATEAFFKGKDDPLYIEISKYMETHPKDMVGDNKDGVKLAEEHTYAFFMESISIEYETQRHCELQQYGKTLDDKGYGIAMRKNSTYRKKLSTAILKLQTSGELDKLKRKWWEEKRGGGQCKAADDDDGTPPLGVQNVEGVFYVTIGGTVLAILLVIVQTLLHTYRLSKKAKITFREALAMEWNAYVDFSSDVKPAVRSKSKSTSNSSKGTGTSNDNLMAPAPSYGFIPTITKQELRD